MKSLADIIQKFIRKEIEATIGVIGTVTEVNDDVCDVEPLGGGAVITDVMLSLDTVDKVPYIVPKIGSKVVISFLSDEKGYVSMFSDVERIELIGNAYSVPKWELLESELIKERDRLDSVINGISSAVVVPLDGGASFKASLTAAIQPTSTITADYSGIPNEKIKHG